MIRFMFGAVRILDPANAELRPYFSFAVESGDWKAVKAMSRAMADARYERALKEYRHFVRIWQVADDLLADGGAFANEETALRHRRSWEILQKLNAWVLGEGPYPF